MKRIVFDEVNEPLEELADRTAQSPHRPGLAYVAGLPEMCGWEQGAGQTDIQRMLGLDLFFEQRRRHR